MQTLVYEVHNKQPNTMIGSWVTHRREQSISPETVVQIKLTWLSFVLVGLASRYINHSLPAPFPVREVPNNLGFHLGSSTHTSILNEWSSYKKIFEIS